MNDLISRQAAISAINERWSKTENFDGWGADISEECEEVLNTIPSADVPDTNVGEWIPCSDRLPHAEKKGYWICTNSGYQCQCRWTNVNHFWTDLTTDWHWHIMDIPQHTKVVAWMPLPKPWKGVDDE